MTRYEYKVVPAPARGEKAKGVKTPEARFARAVQAVLNEMGREGWEYQRAELLPSEERSGLTGSATKWRNLLVFRRPVEGEMAAFEPELLAPPVVGPAAHEGRSEPDAPARVVPGAEEDRVADLTPRLRARNAETSGETAAPGAPAAETPDTSPEETAPDRDDPPAR